MSKSPFSAMRSSGGGNGSGSGDGGPSSPSGTGNPLLSPRLPITPTSPSVHRWGNPPPGFRAAAVSDGDNSNFTRSVPPPGFFTGGFRNNISPSPQIAPPPRPAPAPAPAPPAPPAPPLPFSPAPTPAQQSTTPRAFSECRVSIAVDVSGSTAGRILGSELEFVSSVLRQIISPLRSDEPYILPWNDRAQPPCAPPNVRTLRSSGGTNPVSLLRSHQHFSALRASGLWFLLTDGDIEQWEVAAFSTTLAARRMHGVPCVIVIFGGTSDRPAHCNISVGLSPFAAVPNSALLYQDVRPGGCCYVLATKGCFDGLRAPGVVQPVLDENTMWGGLPTIHPAGAFRDLLIPPPVDLSPEELALSGGLTVNFRTLFDTDLNDAQVGELLGDQQRLQSILLNAQAQGQSASARTWLQRNQSRPPPSMPAEEGMDVDVDGRAAQSVQRLTQALQSTHLVNNNGGVDTLRAELRAAHRRNSQWLSQPQTQTRDSSSRNAVLDAALESLTRTTRSGFTSAALSTAPPYAGWAGASPAAPIHQPAPPPPPLDTTNAFLGECSLCFESDTLLSILFKRPTTLLPNNVPPLVFPLAYGSHPYNDVVSSWMSCHSCSTYLVRQRETPIREVATATLPLVSWSRNSAVWCEALQLALGAPGQPASPLLPVLFLAVLETCLEKTWSRQDGSDENTQRRNALLFARDAILNEVKVAGDDHRGTVGDWVCDVLLRPMRADESLAWKYPMEGFVLMTKIARTHRGAAAAPGQADVTQLLWRKVLHTVASRYVAAVNRGSGSEAERKARINRYTVDAIAATEGPGWMEALRKLGFIGGSDVKALEKMPGEVQWIESVAGNAMGKWLGWLGDVTGILGGGAAECLRRVRERCGEAAVREVMEGLDFEGEIL